MSKLQACGYCKKYESTPIWGHSHCSMHRKCTGKDSWTPEQCEECAASKEKFTQLSDEQSQANREELHTMLAKSASFKAQRNINWSYEDVIEHFLTGHVEAPIEDDTPYNSEKEFDGDTEEEDDNIDERDRLLFKLSERCENMEEFLRSVVIERRHPGHPVSEFSPNLLKGSPDSENTGAEPYFCEGGETYIFFDPHLHTLIGENKVKMGNNIIDVKWHHEHHRAFAQIKKPVSRKSPYVDPEIGHQNLMSLLKLNPCASEAQIGRRKGFVTSLEKESGLALTLTEVKDSEREILRELIEGNKDKLRKHFKDDAFKTVSMANLTSGWSITSSEYIEWAKLQPLDLTEMSDHLGLSLNFVKKELLDEEKFSRCELVDFITGMCLMEKLHKLVRKDTNTYNVSLAISRHFMPTLKNLLINWMKAKVEIRKVILNGYSSSTAKQLLKSSLWDPDIFPLAEIEKIKLNGPEKNIGHLIKSYPRVDSPYLVNKSKLFQQDYQSQRKRKNFGSYRPLYREEGTYRQSSGGEPPRKKPFKEENANSHPATMTSGKGGPTKKSENSKSTTERHGNKKSGFQSRKNNQSTRNKGDQEYSKK